MVLSMDCEYFEKLKDYKYGDLITETRYWVILLAPDQRNLGTCVVALKRDEQTLSGLTEEEGKDFIRIVQVLEPALRKAFKTTMFNWGSLLNSAYLQDPPNPHVHWHLIPRYRCPVEFYGHTFEDPCFGMSTMNARGEPPQVPMDVRKKILQKIKENLKNGYIFKD
jgi:diadenosine tetraphosphate (Ap4A) HIT family hydrolase